MWKSQKHYKHQKLWPVDFTAAGFDIPTAKIGDINKIIKNTYPKKATGLDKIPPKYSKDVSKHYRFSFDEQCK